MGDRVLFQFRNDAEVSPVVYGHWAGHEAPQIIADLRKQMADRPDDISYITARLMGRMCAVDPNGSTGVGCWSATEPVTAKDSQGDAGVFLITLGKRWKVEHMGGYDAEFPPTADIDWERGDRRE